MKDEISPPLAMIGAPSESGYLPMDVGPITVIPIAPGTGGVRAVDNRTGAELWRRQGLGPPLSIWRDCFVTWTSGAGVALVSAETGAVELKPSIPFGLSQEVREGFVTAAFTDDRAHVFCGDLASGRETWRWSTNGSVVAGPVRSTTMTHFGATDFGSTNEVLALRTIDGSEAWRDNVADLTHEESLSTRPGCPAGRPAVIGETIIFHLVRDWTVGYCVNTGRRKWTHRFQGSTQASTVHGGEYHALMSQDYVVLEPETGAELRRVNLESRLPRTKKMFLRPPILVTGGHVWLGSQNGFIFTFTHDGQYVWGCRPKGAAWTRNGAFAILGKRLYYSDSHRTYCFEERPGRRSPPRLSEKTAVPPRTRKRG